jgi:hypothetical protein
VPLLTCKKLRDDIVIVKVSDRKYRIGRIDNSTRYCWGFINYREVKYLTDSLNHHELILELDKYSLPDTYNVE